MVVNPKNDLSGVSRTVGEITDAHTCSVILGEVALTLSKLCFNLLKCVFSEFKI